MSKKKKSPKKKVNHVPVKCIVTKAKDAKREKLSNIEIAELFYMMAHGVVVPKRLDSGICGVIGDMAVEEQISHDQLKLCYEAIDKWPKNSGVYMYPVPGKGGARYEFDFHKKSGNMWTTGDEYCANRLELCRFISQYIEDYEHDN